MFSLAQVIFSRLMHARLLFLSRFETNMRPTLHAIGPSPHESLATD